MPLIDFKVVSQFIRFTKRITLPGFDGVPFFDVAKFFYREVIKGDIQTQARSIAFSFFLAMFPSIIFLFTLIPYVPIEGFQDRLLGMIQSFLPYNTNQSVMETIEEIIKRQNSGLLSFGFLFALLVSTSGVNSLIVSFNDSFENKKKRKGYKQRLVAVYLTLLMAILVCIAIVLIIFTEVTLHFITKNIINLSQISVYFLLAGKYLVLLILALTAISSLYYFGPEGERQRWRFFSPGSILATFLIAVTTIGFNYFLQHFGQYNKIYGSIGTLIIILVYLNFNCLQLLIGFELNNAIEKARQTPGRIKLKEPLKSV